MDKDADALYTGGVPEEEEPDLKDEVFSTACFGKNRMFINWLEFWVYMCNNGVKPKDEEWLAPLEDVTEEVED